jgi:hypothetical protein
MQKSMLDLYTDFYHVGEAGLPATFDTVIRAATHLDVKQQNSKRRSKTAQGNYLSACLCVYINPGSLKIRSERSLFALSQRSIYQP